MKEFPRKGGQRKNHRLENAISDPIPRGSGNERDASLTTNPQGFQSNYESQKKIKQPLFFLILKRMDRNKGGKHQTKKQ